MRGNFVGAHLVGSFALGAGDDHSDVDFVVVTTDVLDAAQETAVRMRHSPFPDQPVHWAQHLEGSYVPAAGPRKPGRPPGRWLYVDNGSRTMEWSSHDDTAVLRWVMRALGGREPRRTVASADRAGDVRPARPVDAVHLPARPALVPVTRAFADDGRYRSGGRG